MIDLGENTGLYLYSAILQANMALLALLGVFVIFRLERVANALKNLDEMIFEYIDKFFNSLGSSIPDEVQQRFHNIGGLQKHIEDQLAKPEYRPSYRHQLEELLKRDSFKDFMSARGKEARRHQEIIGSFETPFGMLLVVVIASLVLLPTASIVHSCCKNVEVLLFSSMVLLNTVTLLKIGWFIKRILTMPDLRVVHIR